MNPVEISGRTLAYLGDAVWSVLVRQELIQRGLQKGSRLQNESIRLVSAKGQTAIYESLEKEGYWSEEEEEIFRRGRNEHSGSVPKNTTVQTYRIATGFEAIIGWLQLTKNSARLNDILQKSFKLREKDNGRMDVREAGR